MDSSTDLPSWKGTDGFFSTFTKRTDHYMLSSGCCCCMLMQAFKVQCLQFAVALTYGLLLASCSVHCASCLS
jgi:hypothetical protein